MRQQISSLIRKKMFYIHRREIDVFNKLFVSYFSTTLRAYVACPLHSCNSVQLCDVIVCRNIIICERNLQFVDQLEDIQLQPQNMLVQFKIP